MNKNHKKLTTEKVSKLLFKQAAPATIGLLVLSFYYIVDTIFVGRGVGTLGITGVIVTTPIMTIIGGLSFTLGVGGASIISRALGAKKKEYAEEIFGTLLVSLISFGLLLILICFIFMDPLLVLFGASEATLPYAKTYLSVLLSGLIFFVFAGAMNNIIRAEGNAKFAMIVMILSAVINGFLDYVFIICLSIGMVGAALATIIAEFSAALAILIYFYSKKSIIRIHFKHLKIKFKHLKNIVSVGSATFIRNVGNSIILILLNNALLFYGGDISIAAYGIISRIFMFGIMPIIGITQGLQPIIGYNFGARKYHRAKKTMIQSITYASIISVLVFVVYMIFLGPIISIFTDDAELIKLTLKAAKIVLITLPIIGFQIIIGGVYQALGKAFSALFVSLLRQIILIIPLLLILPKFFGLYGVFYSRPVADILSAIVCVFLVINEFRIFNKKINATKQEKNAKA
jgi:putative MATE family efflux protein